MQTDKSPENLPISFKTRTWHGALEKQSRYELLSSRRPAICRCSANRYCFPSTVSVTNFISKNCSNSFRQKTYKATLSISNRNKRPHFAYKILPKRLENSEARSICAKDFLIAIGQWMILEKQNKTVNIKVWILPDII